MVLKCCFCFDLPLGYLTFSILVLQGKVCAICIMHYFTLYMSRQPEWAEWSASFGLTIGYLIFSCVCLLISIKGMIQKRSILLYPYTVVLISEIISTFIAYLVASIVVNPFMLLAIILSNGIQAYILMHHISLYQLYKNREASNIQNANVEGGNIQRNVDQHILLNHISF